MFNNESSEKKNYPKKVKDMRFRSNGHEATPHPTLFCYTSNIYPPMPSKS